MFKENRLTFTVQLFLNYITLTMFLFWDGVEVGGGAVVNIISKQNQEHTFSY